MKSNQIFTIKNTLTLLFGILVLSISAQNITIRGTVTYATSGDPVIGATVRLQSATGSGTVTGVDGNYALNNASSNGTLEFSYVGMKTRSVQVNGR